ncbi:MAG: GNAT family N-acetyltransferase [Bacilli bacterium]
MITSFDGSKIEHWFLEHWNREFDESFPISSRLWKQNIIEGSDTFKTFVFGYQKDNQTVGVLVLKHYWNVCMPSILYVSLIYVLPSFRKQTIGKALIEFAKTYALDHDFEKVVIGSDPGCLFSGVFVHNNQCVHDFFLRQGFSYVYKNMNLLCTKRPTSSHDARFMVVKTDEEKQNVLQMIKQHFSKRWFLDVKDILLEELIIVKEQDTIIGFLRISHESFPKLANSLNLHLKYQHLGGIGPLGIVPFYQHQGLGKQMVQFAIQHLFDLGCLQVIVDWTGLTNFYNLCGFSQISQEYIIYQLETGGNKNE